MKPPLIILVILEGLVALAAAQSWSIVKTADEPALQVLCDGKLVTMYHHVDVPKPFFHPVIGPTGEPMTRGFPMDPQEDEETDHPHHQSLWFSHRQVNGLDFWGEPAKKGDPGRDGDIVHRRFSSMRMGGNPAFFTVGNDWLGPPEKNADGETVRRKICEDQRVYHFTRTADGNLMIDWDITIKATNGPVTFGDNKDGGMAIRVIPGLRLTSSRDRRQPGPGHILNAEGVTDEEAWGKRAAWVDCFGPDRKGNPVGVAIFNHPENLRHPTWWHARDYGLASANPFGRRHFEGKDAESGDYTIEADESLRLRYRLLFHRGTPGEAGVKEAYLTYAGVH